MLSLALSYVCMMYVPIYDACNIYMLCLYIEYVNHLYIYMYMQHIGVYAYMYAYCDAHMCMVSMLVTMSYVVLNTSC